MRLIEFLKNTATAGANAPKRVLELPETLEEEEQRRLRARMRLYPLRRRATPSKTKVAANKSRGKESEDVAPI